MLIEFKCPQCPTHCMADTDKEEDMLPFHCWCGAFIDPYDTEAYHAIPVDRPPPPDSM